MFDRLIRFIDSFFYLTTETITTTTKVISFPKLDEEELPVNQEESGPNGVPSESVEITRFDDRIIINGVDYPIPNDVKKIPPLFVGNVLDAGTFPTCSFIETLSSVHEARIISNHFLIDGIPFKVGNKERKSPENCKRVAHEASIKQFCDEEVFEGCVVTRFGSFDISIYVGIDKIFIATELYGGSNRSIGVYIEQPLGTQLTTMAERIVWSHSYARMILIMLNYTVVGPKSFDEVKLADTILGGLIEIVK